MKNAEDGLTGEHRAELPEDRIDTDDIPEAMGWIHAR